MEIMLIFQDRKWLIENYFEDMDGCFWETEELRDNFNTGEEYEINWESIDLYPAICKELQGDYVIIEADEFEHQRYQAKLWGIKKIVNSDDDPEYFI